MLTKFIHAEFFARGPRPRPGTAEREAVEAGRLDCPFTVRRGRKVMAKFHLKLVAPLIVNRTVPPRRWPNPELRTREHFTPDEVAWLIEAVKGNRYGHRDCTMVLVAYRRGLRPAEQVDLRWSQIDVDSARFHVRRAKNGVPSVHPPKGDEMRALCRLKCDAGNDTCS
jgi:integrase